jgi:hypothetical protein
VTLTFGWTTLFIGDMGEGALHKERKKESNCQTNKIKIWSWAPSNWLTGRRLQYTRNLNLRHCTANYRPVLSPERAPYMRQKESNCHTKKCKIWSSVPKGGLDTKTNWPTDHWSQCNLNLNLNSQLNLCGGGLEYIHCSPASRKRRRKGNPVSGGISGPPCSWGI